MPADLVRNPSQEGAVPRPVAPVRGARSRSRIRPPVDTGSGARGHRADECLLLAGVVDGCDLLRIRRHGVAAAAEALAHARVITRCAARKRSGSAADSSAQWTCRPRSNQFCSPRRPRAELARRADCRLAEAGARLGLKLPHADATAAPNSSKPPQRSSRPRLLDHVHACGNGGAPTTRRQEPEDAPPERRAPRFRKAAQPKSMPRGTRPGRKR